MESAVANGKISAHDAGGERVDECSVACDALMTGRLFLKLLYRCGFHREGKRKCLFTSRYCEIEGLSEGYYGAGITKRICKLSKQVEPVSHALRPSVAYRRI